MLFERRRNATSFRCRAERREAMNPTRTTGPARIALFTITLIATFPVVAGDGLLSREQAERKAREIVPGAILVLHRLDHVPGRDVWTFEFARPVQTDTTVVRVDAATGLVISVTSRPIRDQDQPVPKARLAP